MSAEGHLGRKVAQGAAWLMGLHIGDKLIDVISLVILARLLLPTDFGVIALGASIAAGVGLLQRTGFGSALIQNQAATRAHYDTAWTIQVCLSLASAVALLLIAGPAANSFGEPALETVVQVAAVVMILDGFSNIAIIDFQKQLNFKMEVLLRFTKILSAKLSVIAAAFYFMDYRALIVGMLLGSVVGLVLGYILKPYQPRLTFSEARALFGFSLWVQLSTILAYVNRNAQNFVVGSLRGTADVGVLNISNQVASLTGETIQGPINQASYPAFAKKAHDPIALLDQYCSSLAYVTLLAMPTSIGIALMAPHVVPLFLGDKWLDTVPVIQVLALASVASAMTAASNPLFMAINRPRLVTILAATRLSVLVPSLIFTTSTWGLIGAAWAMALLPAVMFPIRQWIVVRALGAGPYMVIAPAVRPIIATLIMVIAVHWIDNQMTIGEAMISRIGEIILLVGVGVSSFAMAIGLQWMLAGRPAGPETEITQVLLRKIINLRGIA